MALVVRNSKELVNPKDLKLKVLLVAPPGFGKTTFVADCPNVGVAVSETGHGKGLLSVATRGIDYVEIGSYEDFDAYCSGKVFQDKQTLGYDSLSDTARTFIKDKALSIPRSRGESAKRNAGVPELDDYGVIAELTRRLTKKLIDQPKHVVVTSGLRIDMPDPESGNNETRIGPDFPGAMFLGSSAMFDVVLIGKNVSKLRDPKDAKSRYTQRVWVTTNQGSYMGKNRLCVDAKIGSFLPAELEYDLETGSGSFNDIYNRALVAYDKFFNAAK